LNCSKEKKEEAVDSVAASGPSTAQRQYEPFFQTSRNRPAFGSVIDSKARGEKQDDSETNDFFKRKYLTGDWGGSRTRWAEKGLTFDIWLTQFVQTMSGDRADDFDYYGNKFDGLVKFDTEKAGLWKGGMFSTHLEIRLGSGPKGTNLFPPVSGLFVPSNGDKKFAVSELKYSQKIGSSTTLEAGLFNTADFGLKAPFTGGNGVEGFSHIVFVALPTGVTPPSTWGFRYIRRIQKKYTFTFFVHDPQIQYPWRTPFEKGVAFMGTFNAPSRFLGKTGSHSFAGSISTKKGTNLRDLWQVILPPEDRIIGTKRGAFSLSYQYDQFFFEKKDDPSQGWGMFAKAQLNDGNPNTIDGGVLFGLGGKGLIPSRSMDRFGIGYFTIWPSSALRDAVPEIPIQRESGLEAFYNFAATPWLKFTADVQYLPPTIAGFESRVYFGVRTKIDF
jgi:porin